MTEATMSNNNPPLFGVIFLLGGPGSGKGTICKMVASKYNIIHLSAGDLLRKEMNSKNSMYKEIIDSHIRGGTIVPVAITCSLLHKAMVEGYNSQKCVTYLIDGFPRNEDNKSGWEAAMTDKTNVLRVIFMDCPESICIKRCLERGTGRVDDNEETLKKRLTQFTAEGMPVIEYYAKKGLVSKVDGSKAKEDVFQYVTAVLDPIIQVEQQ